MNEGVIPSADFKIGKDGRKYPAKRIHMGKKEQVQEASYRGNIGVMELAKFHSSASPSDKEHFTQLMRKKSAAKTEKEQHQIASQIWDHVQKVTGTKLHQMESTAMLSFKLMLENNDDFILQTLADKDINASIKDGKVVVHDHSQHAKAKNMVKRMGMTHEVVKGMKEDVEQIDELSKKTMGSYLKAATNDVAARASATRQLSVDARKKNDENDFTAARNLSGKADKMFNKSWNRRVKMGKAIDKLTQESADDSKYMWKIEGGSGKGKFFGHKDSSVDDHLSAMRYHAKEAQKANNEKRYPDGRHHAMKYHKHKDQIEALGSKGDYMKDSVDVDNTSTVVQEAMPTHEFNKLVHGYLKHKKAAKAGGFKPMSIDQYKRVSVKALSVREETLEEAVTHSVGDVIHIHHHSIAGKDYHGSTNIDKVSANYIQARHPETNEMIRFHTKTKTQVRSVAGSRAGAYVFSTSKNEETVKESDETDTVTMDVPLLTRVLEMAREDIKSDEQLHVVVTRLIEMAKNGTLSMENYKKLTEDNKVVVPTLKPRNPNQMVLAAKKNAAGAHRDKKREMKGGASKHRNRADE